MIAGIFLLWTFWFWMLIVAELVLLFISGARENGILAGFSLLATLAALQLFGDINVLAFIWQHPLIILIGIGIYLLGGIIYVFPKWRFYVKDHHRRYKDLQVQFLDSKGIKDFSKLPNDLLAEWREYFTSMNRWNGIEFRPSVRQHKTRIIDWMMLWPFNMLWTLLNDPIRRFFQHVYYQIHDALQRISDKTFADVSEEIK